MDRAPTEHPSWSIYCRHCFYDLRGSPGDRCPECGTVFDRNDGSTFSRTPGPERLKRILRQAKASLSDAVNSQLPSTSRGDRLAVLSRRIAALTVENEQLWDHFTWVLGILMERGIVTEADVKEQLEFQEFGTLPGVASQDMEIIDDMEEE